MSEFFFLEFGGCVCMFMHEFKKIKSFCASLPWNPLSLPADLSPSDLSPWWWNRLLSGPWAMCRRRDTTRNKKGRNQRTLRTHGPISRLFALWSSAQSPAQSGCCWAAVNICSLDLCWYSFPDFPGFTFSHGTEHLDHPRPRISQNISEFWYVLMNLVVSNFWKNIP